MTAKMVSKGICFDLDGTLIDSGPGGLVHFFKAAKTLKLPVSEEIETRIREVWGQHPHNLIKASWPDADIEKFYKEWERVDIANPFPVFPGVKEALDKLFKHFQLNILTSRNIRTTVCQLEFNDLTRYFGFILAADSGLYKKPDPRSIDPILKWFRKDDLIFVGDTVEGDWRLAQTVGIEFFAVLSGGMDTRDKFLVAGVPENHIIDSAADLPRILVK